MYRIARRETPGTIVLSTPSSLMPMKLFAIIFRIPLLTLTRFSGKRNESNGIIENWQRGWTRKAWNCFNCIEYKWQCLTSSGRTFVYSTISLVNEITSVRKQCNRKSRNGISQWAFKYGTNTNCMKCECICLRSRFACGRCIGGRHQERINYHVAGILILGAE